MSAVRLLLPLAWRSLWRNPRRTIITMLVVSVGLWSILIFSVSLHAWSQSSRDTTLRLVTGQAEIHAKGYLDDPTVAHRFPPPQGKLAAVLAGNDVAAKVARVRISAIVQSEYKTLPVTLMGVDPVSERAMSIIPAQIAQGRYLRSPGDGGIVLGRDLVRKLKTRLGKRVVAMVLDAKDGLAERAFEVVGIYDAPQQIEDEFAFTGIATAQRMASAGRDISEVALIARSDDAMAALLSRLRKAAPGLDIQSWATLAPMPYAIANFFNDFVLIWLWTMFALMAIGIVNTQLMAVFERTREFGLLQALGMKPRLVMGEVALESALLIGAGAVLGIVFAVATVDAFPRGLDLGFLARGAELVGGGHVLYPRIDVQDFTIDTLIVWVFGVLAALWPARRASKVSPVETMGRGL